MVYAVVLLIILFGIYRYDYRKEKSGRLVCWIVLCLLLVCISGLRYRLGQDTITYIGDYADLRPISRLTAEDFEKTRFAPGFVLISSIFKQFTPEFTFFQFFESLVVNSVVFYFFFRNCRHIFFAALLYFFYLYFLLCFQQMREAFSVCVFLLAWPYFRDGKWLYWYAASCIAFLFHMSAIMMFLLPVVCVPGIRQIFIFGRNTVIVCVIITAVGITLNALFFRYLELLAFSASMLERIQAYESSDLGKSILNFNGIIGNLFQYILYPVLALFFLRQRKRDKEEDYRCFNKFNAMVLMSIYVSIFSIWVTIMGRYNNYFFFFAILAMSDWIFGYVQMPRKKVKLRLVYWFIIFLPMFAFHISGTYLHTINRSGTLRAYMVYYPYTTVFDKDVDGNTEKAINYIRRRLM